MLFGHMDTTWGGDEEGVKELGPGYQPASYMDGDWIYGSGAYNMKSGLTSAIAAFEAIVRSGVRPAGDLIMACVVGETCHTQVGQYQGARYRGCGVGTNFMVGNGVTADMAVCPEPTSGRVSIASGGYVYFEIKISGNPGATYARGGEEIAVKPAVDAIEKSQDVMAAIKDWAPGYKKAHLYRGQEATTCGPHHFLYFCRGNLVTDHDGKVPMDKRETGDPLINWDGPLANFYQIDLEHVHREIEIKQLLNFRM